MNAPTSQSVPITSLISIHIKVPGSHPIFAAFPPDQAASLEFLEGAIRDDLRSNGITARVSQRFGKLEDGSILFEAQDPSKMVSNLKDCLQNYDLLPFVAMHQVQVEAVVTNTQVYPVP